MQTARRKREGAPQLLGARAARRVGRGAHHVLSSGSARLLRVRDPASAAVRHLAADAGADRAGLADALCRGGVPSVLGSGSRWRSAACASGSTARPDQLDLRAERRTAVAARWRAAGALSRNRDELWPGASCLHGQLAPTAGSSSSARSLHLTRDPTGTITARIGDPATTRRRISGRRCSQQLAGPRGRRRAARSAATSSAFAGDGHRRRPAQRPARWRADRVDRGGRTQRQGHQGRFVAGRADRRQHAGAARAATAISPTRQRARSRTGDRRASSPAAIPPLIPELAQLRHLQLPISGTLRTRIDLATGAAPRARGSILSSGKGRLQQRMAAEGQSSLSRKASCMRSMRRKPTEIKLEKLSRSTWAPALNSSSRQASAASRPN